MSKRKMLLGLIGANIMGSLSPALFGEAFAASGIDGFCHLMDVDRLRERRLANLLDAIKAAGFAGKPNRSLAGTICCDAQGVAHLTVW
jgi:shikimate 5-dehydrogenase